MDILKKVSVVIPVYGQWQLLKRNIDALMQYDRSRIAEIIVVDDCSTDVNCFPLDSPPVRILRNEKNIGYTGTVNRGLRNAVSEIIVLLDSDAYPTGPFIEKLLSMYDSNEKIGCIGFATVDDTGRDNGNYQYEPSVGELVVGQQLAARLGFLRFWRNRNKLPYSCAVSFRRECITAMGYLDESLFPVLDADNDLSMRICHSRWKLRFTKDIIICHSGGNSYKINYKRVLLFHESRWRLLKKYNKILFPGLTRFLLTARVKMEVMVFKTLMLFQPGNERYREKIHGRRLLMNAIRTYE